MVTLTKVDNAKMMNLGELKNHFEKLPQSKVLEYSLSSPFSWRGSYNKCAFSIEKKQSTVSENIEKIKKAYSETFIGYKGGEYEYNDDTPIHFEEDYSSYSDGEYLEKFILNLIFN